MLPIERILKLEYLRALAEQNARRYADKKTTWMTAPENLYYIKYWRLKENLYIKKLHDLRATPAGMTALGSRIIGKATDKLLDRIAVFHKTGIAL